MPKNVVVIFRVKDEKETIIKNINKIFKSKLHDYNMIVVDDCSVDETLNKLHFCENVTYITIINNDKVTRSIGDFKNYSNVPRVIVGYSNKEEVGVGMNYNQGIDWAEKDLTTNKFVIIYNFNGLDKISLNSFADICLTKNYLVITKKCRLAIGMFDTGKKDVNGVILEYIHRALVAGMKVEAKL